MKVLNYALDPLEVGVIGLAVLLSILFALA